MHLLEQSTPHQTELHSSISLEWIQDENNLTYGWYVSTSLLHSQGYGRGEQCITHCWLPKKSYQPLSNSSQGQILSPPQFQGTLLTKSTKKQVWIPESKSQKASTKGHPKSNATSPLRKPVERVHARAPLREPLSLF